MRLPALPLVGYYMGKPTPMNNAITIRLAMYDQKNATPELLALTDRYAKIVGSHRSFWRTLNSGVGVFGTKDMDGCATIAHNFNRPILVLWGKEDRVFPVSHTKKAMQLLPDAELKLFDRCGHYPQWEQPEAFVTAIEDHLST